jgi:hypothetical protein
LPNAPAAVEDHRVSRADHKLWRRHSTPDQRSRSREWCKKVTSLMGCSHGRRSLAGSSNTDPSRLWAPRLDACLIPAACADERRVAHTRGQARRRAFAQPSRATSKVAIRRPIARSRSCGRRLTARRRRRGSTYRATRTDAELIEIIHVLPIFRRVDRALRCLQCVTLVCQLCPRHGQRSDHAETVRGRVEASRFH